MRASYASPDNANIRPCDFPLGTIYVCYALSEIELGVLLGRDTLDLEERSVGTGVALAALMAEYAPFAVESCRCHFVSLGSSARCRLMCR